MPGSLEPLGRRVKTADVSAGLFREGGRLRKFCKPDYVFGDGALIISRHNGILNKVGTVQLLLVFILFP